MNDFSAKINSGTEIILTGCLCISGIRKIISKRKGELLKRYPEEIIKKALFQEYNLKKIPEKSIIKEAEAGLFDVGEGGLFAALWKMAKLTGYGFIINMNRVDIIQEIIEVCEVFNINPYVLESYGAFILLSNAAEKQVRKLKSNNIYADIIGTIEDNNDKKLICDKRVRYLDRPERDEIYRF